MGKTGCGPAPGYDRAIEIARERGVKVPMLGDPSRDSPAG